MFVFRILFEDADGFQRTGPNLLDPFGGARIRTEDPLLARQMLSQLSYTPVPMSSQHVGPSGIEPPTLRLSVARSSHLSYGPDSLS